MLIFICVNGGLAEHALHILAYSVIFCIMLSVASIVARDGMFRFIVLHWRKAVENASEGKNLLNVCVSRPSNSTQHTGICISATLSVKCRKKYDLIKIVGELPSTYKVLPLAFIYI